MLRTVDMAKSNMIFDPANGYYVPRLTADTSIPIIEKLHGKIWTPVYTVKGQEERLLQWMNQQQILAYGDVRE